MHQQRRFRIALSILVCYLLQAEGADKYTDENRPYEFGFNVEIDGSKQQHRHEKKDKDGIIMGEFGFVTADDVYHVTVYATDKEGRFKILSMKNIHLKKSPATAAGPIPSARQGHSLALPASHVAPAAPSAPAVQAIATPQAIPASLPQASFKQVSLQPPGRSCSSCSLPTTTTQRVPAAPSGNFVPQNQQAYPASAPAFTNNAQQGGFSSQPFVPPVSVPTGQKYPQQSESASNAQIPNAPNNYAQPEAFPPLRQNQPAIPSQSYPSQPPVGSNSPQQGGQQYSNGVPQVPQTGSPGRTSKQYTGPEQQFGSNLGPSGPQGPGQVQKGQAGPVKPTLVSAQMQIVDKNTDIHALGPGERQGLPDGLTTNDMTQLLYTFNYTLGFHGHFEEGYTNGVKKGYYFVTGRNGVRTRIDYVADDTGFHPRVSQEVLDLLSEDVPKPETEKDEKYGLKGYEFKWLYYPVDSKRP